MAWRVARSLDTLLHQLNARFPNRNKASDGSIGDTAHQNRNSDHNPWYGPGIVTARDYTHDPRVGLDIGRLSDELAASRDPRIKYIIANGYILDSRPGNRPWQWVKYNGSNPHTKHLHLSVMPNSSADDTRPWNLPMLGGSGAPVPPPPTFADVKGFLMALNDVEQKNVHNWILDIHRFLFHPGAIANRLDPKNPTKGADMIPDMASWAFRAMVDAGAARKAAESANFEVTYKHPSRVEGSEYKDTMLGYTVNADAQGYRNEKRLEEVEAKLDAILARLGEQPPKA